MCSKMKNGHIQSDIIICNKYRRHGTKSDHVHVLLIYIRYEHNTRYRRHCLFFFGMVEPHANSDGVCPIGLHHSITIIIYMSDVLWFVKFMVEC